MPLPSLTPVEDDVLSALRNFLLTALPNATEVVAGQINRLAEPIGPDFVVMTPILRKRLETNVDLYADCAFAGSVTGNVLTVTQILQGTIAVGNTLFGSGVPAGTFVASQISGSIGGTGTYQLSGTLSVISGTLSTGVFMALMPVEITVQCDFHGPNSGNYVQIASTLFRDRFATEAFEGFGSAPPGWAPIPPGGTVPLPFTGIRPLYADDPRQTPFLNAESQYEFRWSLDFCMQANPIVSVGQTFAGQASVTLDRVG